MNVWPRGNHYRKDHVAKHQGRRQDSLGPLNYMNKDGMQTATTDDLFRARVVLFALPGALHTDLFCEAPAGLREQCRGNQGQASIPSLASRSTMPS